MISIKILLFCFTISQTASLPEKFEVIWNVPTFLCMKNYNINFEEVLANAGIIVNKNDTFDGDKIKLLYSPGDWPSLEHNKTANGGRPQKGNLANHLKNLTAYIEKKIKADFNGFAVLDMESWRPVFRQNVGWMQIYRNLGIEEVKVVHPDYKPHELFSKAAQNFEPFAKQFMLESMNLSRSLRPNAKWGYYGFPYCLNMGVSKQNRVPDCPEIVRRENDGTMWLYESYYFMYPSVYITHDDFTDEERYQLIQGRVKEFQRINSMSKNELKFYPYVWYFYNLTQKFLSLENFKKTLEILMNGGMDGAIIWGSSNDLATQENCQGLFNYAHNVIIPVVKSIHTPKMSSSS
uniref:Hyaluronidase n=1 Tax=Corethrella appendiculata TaxID=1370023 RepID=U5EUF4_9DIPT